MSTKKITAQQIYDWCRDAKMDMLKVSTITVFNEAHTTPCGVDPCTPHAKSIAEIAMSVDGCKGYINGFYTSDLGVEGSGRYIAEVTINNKDFTIADD